MRRTILLMSLGCALAADAAEPLYTTTASQGGSAGTSWASSVIWSLNGTGPATAPAAGNTYEAVFNGTALGSATATTLLRPPYSAGTPNLAVFPGDSLILDTNTQLRLKALSTSGTSAEGLNYESPTNSFPGANGLPGLVLNGGCLNVGDTGDAATILGTVQAAPGTLSYLDPADTLTGNSVNRGLIIAAQLSGSGTVALIDGNIAVPQLVTGTSNTFSGGWIVMAGWLEGAGDGTDDGYNSLGTNAACTFVVDPLWSAPAIFDASAVLANGPAMLDLGSAPVANLGGALVLTNGGQLNLHSTVFFSAVTIEGTALTRSTHAYADLVAQFPGSFPAGGSGSITVQPYAPPPSLPPAITAQPLPEMLYAGGTARFTVSATGHPPLTYQWQKNGSNLTDGGNISGSTNTSLVVSNVSSADSGTYRVTVSAGGLATSSSLASLTVMTASEPYASAVMGLNPAAFYELNETGDPATNTYAFDSAGGYTGTYGAGVQNGNPANNNIMGPGSAEGFPGFAAGHKAGLFVNGTGTSRVTLPALNLGANATNVTLTAWVNPIGAQLADEGIVFCRAGTTVAGLTYSGSTDANGNFTLGYNWDNDIETYSWDSRLAPPAGQWSFVALVVTPSNAVIQVMNTNGLASSTFWHNHGVPQPFDGTTLIGDDNNDAGNGSRVFNGSLADVAIFNSSLSDTELVALYSAASGKTQFPPYIATQPLSASLYPAMGAQFNVAAGGSDPLSIQWQARASGSGAFTNVTDGGRIAGSATETLTINNLAATDGADFQVVITNAYGALTSGLATLTMLPTQPAEAITMSNQQAAGNDWDTGSDWSDGNPASISAFEFPGSTYEVLAGARLRTPLTIENAVFPGDLLTIDGDGVFTNSPAAGASAAEIRFKQPTSGSSVTFKKLVMNGGQLDLGNDGLLLIEGEIDILTNTPMYVDSGGDANRQFQIDAWLTGAGSIEYHSFDTSFTGYLNVTGRSNTFSGAWNVVQGVLLGTSPNCLGTNTITIGTGGALETTYDLANTNGTLNLFGQMLLHQNDTFASVLIDGTRVPKGVYTFAQLTNLYPAHFPASWTPVAALPNFSTGSGSLNVAGVVAPPVGPEPLYTTTTTQTGSPGTSWAGSVIWSLNGTGPATAPAAGNTYEAVFNGTALGSATATTLLRPPYSAGTPNIAVFPGDSLILDTNTQLRLKALSTSGTSAQGLNYESPTNSFPGANGLPGLVLNGGCLNVGDTGDAATILGTVQAAPGTLSYLDPADTLSGNSANRGLIIAAQLSGSGTVALIDGNIAVPQLVTGASNTFSGGWIVMAGWLEGAGDGTGDGYNSLGTNTACTFVVDPLWSAPAIFDASAVLANGPAMLDLGSAPVANLGGALVLTNGGQLNLHSTVFFSAVTIEGTALTRGTHAYAELVAQFPTNFPAGGSGSITVQPYAPPPAVNVLLSIQKMAGASLQLSWPQGVLLQADALTGPWQTNSASSPYLFTPTAPQKFYRVIVR